VKAVSIYTIFLKQTYELYITTSRKML